MITILSKNDSGKSINQKYLKRIAVEDRTRQLKLTDQLIVFASSSENAQAGDSSRPSTLLVRLSKEKPTRS